MCLHSWWNCFVDPLMSVNTILYEFELVDEVLVLFVFVVVVTGVLFNTLILLVNTELLFDWFKMVEVVPGGLFWRLAGSIITISTLKRTFRAKNLSGDLYSHRNKLGLFILWIKSCVLKNLIFKMQLKFQLKSLWRRMNNTYR